VLCYAVNNNNGSTARLSDEVDRVLWRSEWHFRDEGEVSIDLWITAVPMMVMVDMLPCAVQGQSPTCHCDRHSGTTANLHREASPILSECPRDTESQLGNRGGTKE